ncbi:MAG: carbohydrate-binding domain-containing protein [Dactylosporangium sp.]|nr:carbohydrate-binding domain-containing protein [Dactylosporangium sp.]
MQRSTLKTVVPVVCAAAVLAGAFSAVAIAADEAPSTSAQLAVARVTPEQVMAANATDHDDPADYVWNAADVVPITLNGSGATSGGSGVSISGSVVTIASAGTYQLTGTLTNGQVVVDTTDSTIVRIILSGASISSSTSAPIQVNQASKAMVVLADGTTNTLSDASSYVYPDASTDEPNGALFSTADLTISGTGSLTVRGNAYDGIVSKDGLIINSGTITVDAVDDGIRGKDYLVVDDGTITVTAGGDGLKSTNDSDATMGYVSIASGTVTVTASGDGVSATTDVVTTGGALSVGTGGGAAAMIGDDVSAKGVKGAVSVVIGDGQITADSADDAIHSDETISISGGTLNLASGDDAVHADTTLEVAGGTLTVTRSYEGLEATKIIISGGTSTITSSDDGINGSDGVTDPMMVAAGVSLTVSGGTTVVNAGGDGVDSNGTMTMTGGTIVVNGPTVNNNGALDVNSTFTVSSGTLLAAGSSGMAVAPATSSAQGWVSAAFTATQASGTIVHVATTTGTRIASFRSSKTFQSVIFSSSQITMGQSYAIYTGGSVSGTSTGGMYSDGSLSGATQVMTVVAGEHTGGMGGPGGGGFPPQTDPATTGPAVPTTTSPAASTSSTPGATGGACTAAYAITSEWSGGFQAEVQVTAGSSAISGWTVTWTFANGQTIGQAWNATVTASGSSVTATNVAYNGALSASGGTSFGFIGTWNGTNAVTAVTCTAS